MANPPPVFVDADEIRRLFNEGRFYERMMSGELTAVVRADTHPTSTKAGEPYCTRSQTIAYLTKKRRAVAIVHQYVRKDGTLGASRRPDPKWLLVAGKVYLPKSR